MRLSRRRGWGLRPKQEDPRPHGEAQCPDLGEVAGVHPAGLGRWAEPAARAEGFWGSEGPGAPHILPALIPPAHLSQRQAPRGPCSPLPPPPPPVQKIAATTAADVRTR